MSLLLYLWNPWTYLIYGIHGPILPSSAVIPCHMSQVMAAKPAAKLDQLSAAGRSHCDVRSRFAPYQDTILRPVETLPNVAVIDSDRIDRQTLEICGFLKLDMHKNLSKTIQKSSKTIKHSPKLIPWMKVHKRKDTASACPPGQSRLRHRCS